MTLSRPYGNGMVPVALGFSLLLHALIYAAWPHLQATPSMTFHVQGELLAPLAEQPPRTVDPPALPPVPRQETLSELPPLKPRDEQKSTPREKPDSGVALPLIAETADKAADAGDYVVPEVPSLKPDDELPSVSKPGTMPLGQYTPSYGADSANGDEEGNGSREDVVDRNELAEYGRVLQERAGHMGGYPAMALKRRWQGRVKVQVRYARDGQPWKIEIKEPSGYKLLDDRALEMVRQACNGSPLPDALNRKSFLIVVPVDFRLL